MEAQVEVTGATTDATALVTGTVMAVAVGMQVAVVAMMTTMTGGGLEIVIPEIAVGETMTVVRAVEVGEMTIVVRAVVVEIGVTTKTVRAVVVGATENPTDLRELANSTQSHLQPLQMVVRRGMCPIGCAILWSPPNLSLRRNRWSSMQQEILLIQGSELS